ncbi:MAG TPA: FxLYD domain-containing protein [Bryobacteraceae bacterium]|nr:FxLYD domain-containing protein [Bryobacteraceae bacterium]
MGSRTILYMLAVVLLAGGALAWFVMHPAAPASAPPLTPEAKAYVRNLQLSGVTMKATDSYVNQMVTEIEGKITNSGDRVVKQADVYCIFYNSYGEMILRERVAIVKSPLKPGESRDFRLPFDNIPSSWNNQMPQLVIARIEFA